MTGHGRDRVIEVVTAEENLAADATALAAGAPSARVAVLSDTALTLGVSQPDEAASATRARAAGWPVLRRSTGGSGVLHLPGDLAWSVVLPRGDPRAGRDYTTAYERLGAPVVAFLRGASVRAEWRPSRALSDSFCFLGSRGWALEVDGRVAGGAAQHLTPTHLLHHGTIARTIDRPALVRLFDLSERVAQANLTSLVEAGVRAEPPELAHELGRRLQEWVDGGAR